MFFLSSFPLLPSLGPRNQFQYQFRGKPYMYIHVCESCSSRSHQCFCVAFTMYSLPSGVDFRCVPLAVDNWPCWLSLGYSSSTATHCLPTPTPPPTHRLTQLLLSQINTLCILHMLVRLMCMHVLYTTDCSCVVL